MIDLNSGEKIYTIKHRHKIVLLLGLLPLVFSFLLLFIVITFVSFKSFQFPEDLIKILPQLEKINFKIFSYFIFSLFALIIWMGIGYTLLDYYLDYWIVTNQRIIDIELKGLFNHKTSSIPLEKIQDLTVKTEGILATFFKYGDLIIQTAGSFEKFSMKDIAHPEIIKKLIFEVKLEDKKNKEGNG